MVETVSWTFTGDWRRLRNLAARPGNIHDDEAARKAGFEGGFVPGSTVGTLALSAVLDRYGDGWLEGGWYELKFVTPVYVHNEVRVVGRSSDDDVELRVETREGRLCCSGIAGPGGRLPWEPALDGMRGADEVLPGVEIGLPYGEADFVVQREDVERPLDAAGERNPWFLEGSPWGPAAIPPEQLMPIALHLEPPYRPKLSGVHGPGMWSGHWLRFNRPLLQGETYHIRQRIADKGRSGRMVFITYEFSVTQDGIEVALGRHQVKLFAND